jgi:hypothetical protein
MQQQQQAQAASAGVGVGGLRISVTAGGAAPGTQPAPARPTGLSGAGVDLDHGQFADLEATTDADAVDAVSPVANLTLSDVFAAKQHELPGLFQEIGLFSVFRSLCPCLWYLWELAITGQPILVMGPSPELCGTCNQTLLTLPNKLHLVRQVTLCLQ